MKTLLSYLTILFVSLFLIAFFFKAEIKNFLLMRDVKNKTDQILEQIKEIDDTKKRIQNLIKKSNQEILDFIDVPKKNKNIPDDSIYNDVISRQKTPFGDKAGRHVNVHETAHGIHSDLRNEYQKKLGYKCNAFYCLNGKAVILRDPNITIKNITKNIPKNLRSYRYQLYFVNQLKDWDDMPTYVLDEWNAYILGSECALEDVQRGLENPKSDAVSGCLDFSIYSIAMAKTVKELDPKYWEEHPKFKEFIKYNLKRAEKTFKSGKDIFKSSGQDKLLDSFLNDKKSDDLRNFMKKEFGDYFLNI